MADSPRLGNDSHRQMPVPPPSADANTVVMLPFSSSNQLRVGDATGYL
jgi:hypothetical protein